MSPAPEGTCKVSQNVPSGLSHCWRCYCVMCRLGNALAYLLHCWSDGAPAQIISTGGRDGAWDMRFNPSNCQDMHICNPHNTNKTNSQLYSLCSIIPETVSDAKSWCCRRGVAPHTSLFGQHMLTLVTPKLNRTHRENMLTWLPWSCFHTPLHNFPPVWGPSHIDEPGGSKKYIFWQLC